MLGLKRGLFALGVLAGLGAASDLTAFSGAWIAEGSSQTTIDRAISSYGSRLDSSTRVMVQQRLKSTNQPTLHLAIAALDSGRKVAIGYEDSPGMATSIDGSPLVSKGRSGEEFQMRVVMKAGVLVESYEAEDGTRTNRYSLSPDGKAMSMEVKVESPYMPEPLGYRVGFTRK